jgi:hypothetical protein
MSDTKKELEEMCKNIAEKLGLFASGYVYDNEEGKMVDKDEIVNEDGEYDEDRYEDLYQYLFEDNLGIKILTSLDGSDYFGAEICVAWGGPNIYIETRDSYVKGYWGSDQVEYPLSYTVRDRIDDEIEELRSCY